MARFWAAQAKVDCGSNLLHIGHALSWYADANGGHFPPDLATLFSSSKGLGMEAAICYTAPGGVLAESPAELSLPNRCSYIYVGFDLPAKPNPNCITVIEDPANHGFDGCNILYADGHVETVDLPRAMQSLNDLAAGKNPPSTTTALTAVTARQDYETNWKSRMPMLKSGVWRIPTTQPKR
jgi:prepilin-type processing-associated H-X9-DG protein